MPTSSQWEPALKHLSQALPSAAHLILTLPSPKMGLHIVKTYHCYLTTANK